MLSRVSSSSMKLMVSTKSCDLFPPSWTGILTTISSFPGLAPVRSAKQDQIHSSLVATLLALMDGMDGRGQVVVIGATNRPDNVDPALRRPGRFDREFYFPLPNIEARKKIIQINTAKWNPQLEEPFVNQLATLTKGYGGADLRVSCRPHGLYLLDSLYWTITNLELILGTLHGSRSQRHPASLPAGIQNLGPSASRPFYNQSSSPRLYAFSQEDSSVICTICCQLCSPSSFSTCSTSTRTIRTRQGHHT